MQKISQNARVTDCSSVIASDTLSKLADLYDQFYNALDPYRAELGDIEKLFNSRIQSTYNSLSREKPDFELFKKKIIKKCRIHIRESLKKPII